MTERRQLTIARQNKRFSGYGGGVPRGERRQSVYVRPAETATNTCGRGQSDPETRRPAETDAGIAGRWWAVRRMGITRVRDKRRRLKRRRAVNGSRVRKRLACTEVRVWCIRGAGGKNAVRPSTVGDDRYTTARRAAVRTRSVILMYFYSCCCETNGASFRNGVRPERVGLRGPSSIPVPAFEIRHGVPYGQFGYTRVLFADREGFVGGKRTTVSLVWLSGRMNCGRVWCEKPRNTFRSLRAQTLCVSGGGGEFKNQVTVTSEYVVLPL